MHPVGENIIPYEYDTLYLMYRFEKYLKISLNIHCWFAGLKLITMMYLNNRLGPFNFLGWRHFRFFELLIYRAVDKVKGQCHEILSIVISWFYSLWTLYSYRAPSQISFLKLFNVFPYIKRQFHEIFDTILSGLKLIIIESTKFYLTPPNNFFCHKPLIGF